MYRIITCQLSAQSESTCWGICPAPRAYVRWRMGEGDAASVRVCRECHLRHRRIETGKIEVKDLLLGKRKCGNYKLLVQCWTNGFDAGPALTQQFGIANRLVITGFAQKIDWTFFFCRKLICWSGLCSILYHSIRSQLLQAITTNLQY